jgi:hypothetical protein
MFADIEAPVFSNCLLALLDLIVTEFFHMAALQADNMIVVTAFIQFKHCLATLEVMAHQQASLLKLRKYAVNSCQPYIFI